MPSCFYPDKHKTQLMAASDDWLNVRINMIPFQADEQVWVGKAFAHVDWRKRWAKRRSQKITTDLPTRLDLEENEYTNSLNVYW